MGLLASMCLENYKLKIANLNGFRGQAGIARSVRPDRGS